METLEKSKNGDVPLRQRDNGVSGAHHQNTQKSRKRLPEKEFRIRQSLITEMLERPEIGAAHNMVIAIAVHLVVFGIVSDLIKHGSVDLGLRNIKNVFGKPVLTLKVLAALHLTPILVVYPVLRIWAHCRAKICASSSLNSLKKPVDTAYYSIMTVIFLLFYIIPGKVQFGEGRLPIASAAIIVMEQLRLTMKMYAFVRSNTPRVLQYTEKGKTFASTNKDDRKSREESNENNSVTPSSPSVRRRKQESLSKADETPKNDAASGDKQFKYFDDVPYPSIGHLVYFLYAPTSIYRDNYPRVPTRSWSFIFWHIMHILGSIVFYNLMHHRFGYVLLQNFGPAHPMSGDEFVNTLLCQVALGVFGYLIAWAIILHSTQNIFAELLRFGDRCFYREWWTCTSMGEYHRMWNIPVQDWLYTYVYKEAWDLGLGKKMKWLPAILVFFISNVFHEYGMSFACGFFCPVMGIMFGGPGTFLTFLPNKKFPKLGNIFMHWSMGLGHAFIHMFYIMEHFARVNDCPPFANPTLDFFIPRFITCDAVKWN